jgi:hypothetical protein
LRFQEIATQIAAENRERFLRTLQRAKQATKAQRARTGTKG